MYPMYILTDTYTHLSVSVTFIKWTRNTSTRKRINKYRKQAYIHKRMNKHKQANGQTAKGACTHRIHKKLNYRKRKTNQNEMKLGEIWNWSKTEMILVHHWAPKMHNCKHINRCDVLSRQIQQILANAKKKQKNIVCVCVLRALVTRSMK